MACAPSKAKLQTDPALKAIFSELSWRNQVVMELAEAIASRCEAAQKFDPVERYQEDLPEEKRTWLFFPAGELDRRLAFEKNRGEERAALAPKSVLVIGGQDGPRINKFRFLIKTVPLPRTILPLHNQTYPDVQLETSNGPQRR